MDGLENLLSSNRAWADKIKARDPEFFEKLAHQQKPEYLWIGCSDSRVPANEIVDMLPGEIFVHRNIANVVVHTDLNCLSVLQFAVEVLGVKHVIVCGHYGCGGVKAALEGKDHGLIDNWLRHIMDVYRYNEPEFDNLDDDEQVHDRLCELNVVEQVHNVCATTIMRNAWASGQQISVHGLIYSIQDGILKDMKVSRRGK
jgi:carbonic anhydrase